MLRIVCLWFCLWGLLLGWTRDVAAVNSKPAPLNGPEFLEYELKTGHFIFFIPPSMKYLMPQIAQEAEIIFDTLQALIGYEPQEKIRITLTENVRYFNAYSSTYAQKGIELFGYFPLDFLPFNGSQHQMLIRTLLHELVHYMNLSTANHVFGFLQKILGNYWSPVQMSWNTFLIEGLAVYFETLLVSQGRGNSSYVNMIFRSAVLEGGFEEGKRFSYSYASAQQNDIFYEPRGSTPYYFGYLFFRSLTEHCGLDCLKKLLQDAGDYPFYINGYMPENTSLKTVYEMGVALLKKSITKEVSQLQAKKLTPYQKLTQGGFTKAWPRFDESGENIFYIEYNLTRPLSFVGRKVSDPVEQKSQFRSMLNSTNRISSELTTRPKRFVFVDGLDEPPFTEVPVVKDLARMLDEGTGKFEELPQEHLRRMVWLETCGPQNWVALIQEGFAQEIWLFDDHLRHIKTITSSKQKSYLGLGLCDEPGQFFYVTADSGQGKDILQMDVWTGKTQVLVHNQAINEHLVFRDPQNLAFVSDLNHVFNLYQVNLKTHQVQQLTEVLTGLFYPSFSKDGRFLVASVYGMEGMDLALFKTSDLLNLKIVSQDKQENKQFPRIENAQIQKFSSHNLVFKSGPFQVRDNPDDAVFFDLWAQEYSPWRNLVRDMIYLRLEGDSLRGFLARGILKLADTLNFHQNYFTLSVAPSSALKTFSWEYSYNRLPCLFDFNFDVSFFKPQVSFFDNGLFVALQPSLVWPYRLGQNTQWQYGVNLLLNYMGRSSSSENTENRQIQSSLTLFAELKEVYWNLASVLPVQGYRLLGNIEWHFLEKEENPIFIFKNAFIPLGGSRDRGAFVVGNLNYDYYWHPHPDILGVLQFGITLRQVLGSKSNSRSLLQVSEKSWDTINPANPDFYFPGVPFLDRIMAQDLQYLAVDYATPFFWFNHYLDDHIFYLGQTTWTSGVRGLHANADKMTDGMTLVDRNVDIKSLWATSVYTKLSQKFSVTRLIQGSIFGQLSSLLYSEPNVYPLAFYFYLGAKISASL